MIPFTISVFGATGNVLIRLNLSKSIHDLHKTDFWKVTPVYNSSLWWTDKILFDIHFAANGDRYSSAQGSLIWGGSFFRKNGTTDWIRTIQGLGFDAFGEFSRQQFYEKSSGKVFMVQYLDERIYWADTSRVVGSYSPDRQLGIALYPNPVSAGGHLYLNFEDYNGPCQYILEDLNGRLWSRGRIDRSSTGLDVPNTPGCYRLSLQNARGDKTSRLILVLFR
ncbi:MAG TPA: hypothetical protein VFX48_06390 [Saprospiraceae bacterium]|nr:hypothetical protein [Saprospiraceae bacterium]